MSAIFDKSLLGSPQTNFKPLDESGEDADLYALLLAKKVEDVSSPILEAVPYPFESPFLQEAISAGTSEDLGAAFPPTPSTPNMAQGLFFSPQVRTKQVGHQPPALFLQEAISAGTSVNLGAAFPPTPSTIMASASFFSPPASTAQIGSQPPAPAVKTLSFRDSNAAPSNQIVSLLHPESSKSLSSTISAFPDITNPQSCENDIVDFLPTIALEDLPLPQIPVPLSTESSVTTAVVASSLTPSPATPKSSSHPTPAASASPILRSPADTHYPHFIDENFKPNGEPNKHLRSLYKKRMHTILSTPSTSGDITEIRKQGLKPDQTGLIRVKRMRFGSEIIERGFMLHAENNPDGQNRLIPVEGDGVKGFTGSELQICIEKFRKAWDSGIVSTFAEFLKTYDKNEKDLLKK